MCAYTNKNSLKRYLTNSNKNSKSKYTCYWIWFPSSRDYATKPILKKDYTYNRNLISVSDSTDNPQFAIDSQGQLTLARPLNFESQPSHVIGILALTDSSPPLTALAEIILQVQDENDHDPQFESNTYVLKLAENVPEGSSIMRGEL